MKNIILSVLFFCVTAYLHAQDGIKSRSMYVNKSLTEFIEYNKEGKIIVKKSKIESEPVMWFDETFIYKNDLLSSSSKYMNGASVADYEYFYDGRKMLERIREKQFDSVVSITYFEYNAFDKINVETSYIGQLKKITTTYSYNNFQNVTNRTETIIDGDKMTILANDFIYDENKKLVGLVSINNKDTISNISFKYDTCDRKVRQDAINMGDTTLTILWKYKKNLTKPFIEKHIADNSIVRQTKFFYRKNGLIKKEIIVDYRNYSGKMKPEKMKKVYKYEKHD